MRSALFLLALASPLASAQALIHVAANSMLQLAPSAQVLEIKRLHIGEHATLMVPASVTEVRVSELLLEPEGRIAIAASQQPFYLHVLQGEIATGAQITARGAPGTELKPAIAGRTLTVRLERVVTQSLLIDARGGTGSPGFNGLHGANGKPGGCLWGQSLSGADGGDGSDGQTGAAGGKVRIEVPQDFPAEHILTRLEGGSGGRAGEAGQGGAKAMDEGCWIYSAQGAKGGQAGRSGQAGLPGPDGSMDLVRF
ncbi:collagen pro alpha-chain precursor [Pseudomonas sp. J237]|nr:MULTISPECIES: collagen-like triple helix repeat-containing protein [Pseudomonas]OEO26550.1 collagen pro alpha-chain precursor [Pseudomonas sp. J237]